MEPEIWYLITVPLLTTKIDSVYLIVQKVITFAGMTDKDYIDGILQNDYTVLQRYYQTFLPEITKMVVAGKGTPDDAMDVFQEATLVLYRQLSKSDFSLQSSLSTYLTSVAKHIWWRLAKKKYRTEVTLEGREGLIDRSEDTALQEEIEKREKRRYYQEKFALLGDDCRLVLQHFFDKVPLLQIAEKLNYTTDYIKKKNLTCKKKLKQLLQNDPRFEEYRH